MRYKMVESISEVREYEVELPEGATEAEIREAAYNSGNFITKFGETNEVEFFVNGKPYYEG